jgi:hypothetical protein
MPFSGTTLQDPLNVCRANDDSPPIVQVGDNGVVIVGLFGPRAQHSRVPIHFDTPSHGDAGERPGQAWKALTQRRGARAPLCAGRVMAPARDCKLSGRAGHSSPL